MGLVVNSVSAVARFSHRRRSTFRSVAATRSGRTPGRTRSRCRRRLRGDARARPLRRVGLLHHCAASHEVFGSAKQHWSDMTFATRDETEAGRRLHRRLRRELHTVERTKFGTWTTSSNLPHEIRLHRQAGADYVRVSAGTVVGVRATKALLTEVNFLNIERAFTRRIVGDGNVVVVAEMPLASLRPGDLDDLVSITLSFARLDAALLATHGGRPVTEPPEALAPELDRQLHSWRDVLLASRTATRREFNVWLDDWCGVDCWLDLEDASLVVAIGQIGQGNEYPFCLLDLRDALDSLQEQADDED